MNECEQQTRGNATTSNYRESLRFKPVGYHPALIAIPNNGGNLRLVLDMRVPNQALAVYKSGTGTRGQGHWDACVGTRDEGLEDIKYGTRGRVGRGRGDVKYRDAGDAGCE